MFARICRYTSGMTEWELSARGVDNGESELEAAKREGLEETGYTSAHHELMYSYYLMNGSANKLFHHAPPDYVCPFCSLIQNKANIESLLKQTDIIFQGADVTAFMATRKYPNNQGHVLIIPNEHYENIYDLPLDVSSKVHALSRDIALAMKAEYPCDGILLRQHNEPAGDQNIWHYHLHVIPRYRNDGFHSAEKVPFEAAERAEYAQRLKNWFCRHKEHLAEESESEKS